MNNLFGKASSYKVGCNYWASHAGPDMWKKWDAAVVDRDFALLEKYNLNTVRVFPTWRDFQPLEKLHSCCNHPEEYRRGEEPLEDSFEGAAGIDPVMMERFGTMLELAGKHHLQLIVGLITGWMSGRMFAPHAFDGDRLMRNDEVVHFQVRFVRCMVRRFKSSPAIIAWDPGNECNCLDTVDKPAQWRWFDTICNAIRREDPDHPILSGTNTRVDSSAIRDMTECCEVLCTHSYPAFSKYCRVDPIDTMRDAFEAVYMNRCCMDIGRTDSIVEETGSFGVTQNSEDVSARHSENILWNTFAHDCRGLLWWCAFDQTKLENAPYDWNSMERELGMFDLKGKPKLLTRRFASFAEIARKFPLPDFQRDAVCILTKGQDQWSAGFMSFLLAKEAGFDVEFAFSEDDWPEAELYLMPSISGFQAMQKHSYLKLLKRVYDGASLYISADDSVIEPWGAWGIPVHTVCESSGKPARIFAPEYGLDLELPVKHEIVLEDGGAEIFARDGAGHPAFSCMPYGKGKLFFLNVPLETALAPKPRLFEPGAAAYHRIYEILAEKSGIVNCRAVRKTNPLLSVTEHPVSAKERIVCLVNNTPQPMKEKIFIAPKWTASVLHGRFSGGRLELPANTGALLRLTKEKGRK